jgi:hypothetical protein
MQWTCGQLLLSVAQRAEILKHFSAGESVQAIAAQLKLARIADAKGQ